MVVIAKAPGTGAPPFPNGHALAKERAERPVHLQERCPDFPPELCDRLMSALADEPAQRPTAEALSVGITRVLETERGLVVVTLVPNGPADRAGIQGFRVVKTQRRRGPFVYEEQRLDRSHADLIVAIDGRKVRSADDLLSGVEARRPGETVELSVVRDGQEGVVSITLGAGE